MAMDDDDEDDEDTKTAIAVIDRIIEVIKPIVVKVIDDLKVIDGKISTLSDGVKIREEFQSRLKLVEDDIIKNCVPKLIEEALAEERNKLPTTIQTALDSFSNPRLDEIDTSMANNKTSVNKVAERVKEIWEHIEREKIINDKAKKIDDDKELMTSLRKDAEKVIARADSTLMTLLVGSSIFQVVYSNVIEKAQKCTFPWLNFFLIFLSIVAIIMFIGLIWMRMVDFRQDLYKINTQYHTNFGRPLTIKVDGQSDAPSELDSELDSTDDGRPSDALLPPESQSSDEHNLSRADSFPALLGEADLANQKFKNFYLLVVAVFGVFLVAYEAAAAYVVRSSC